MLARIAGLIGGSIRGVIIGGIFLGLSWILQTVFAIPPQYPLTPLFALPMALCWTVAVAVLWSTSVLHLVGGLTLGIEPNKSGYGTVITAYTILAFVGALINVIHWYLPSPFVILILGLVVGLVFAGRVAAVMESGWGVVASLAAWIIVAFMAIGFAPGSNSSTVDGLASVGITQPFTTSTVLYWTAGVGGLLGLILPPTLPTPQTSAHWPQPSGSQPASYQPPAPAPGVGTSTEVARQAQLREILNRQRKQ